MQHKALPFLTAPMQSSGDYLMVPGLGLKWQQQQPWAQTTLVKGDSVWQQHQQLTLADSAFSDLLSGLLSGDLEKLANHFAITASGELDRWQLQMTPTTAKLIPLFEKIELTGAVHIEQIILTDPSGSNTNITLHNVTVTVPTESERAELR